MSQAIALFASSRRNGHTGRLMDEVAERLDIDVVDLAERSISAYDYEHRNRNDDFEGLMEAVLRHKQIIFASPVYWYAVSPPMKVFLDRISDLLDLPDLFEKGRQLRSKQAYVLCTSVYDEIPEPFIGAFRATFDYLGMSFGGYLHANCGDGYKSELYQSDIAAFVERIKGSDRDASARA
jgi:multimeric flavodoxin WrbA